MAGPRRRFGDVVVVRSGNRNLLTATTDRI